MKLKNVKFNLASNDLRPALVCEDGIGVEVSDWKLPETTGAESVIRFENVQNAVVKDVTGKVAAKKFVLVEGNSKAISVKDNKITGITN
ncbi:hypothetical protein D3C86_1595920 [compost metagenome]